jgi:hypothetical protein
VCGLVFDRFVPDVAAREAAEQARHGGDEDHDLVAAAPHAACAVKTVADDSSGLGSFSWMLINSKRRAADATKTLKERRSHDPKR